MIASLKKLKLLVESKKFESNKDAPLASMQISSYNLSVIFSTHPPLEERIKALESRYDIM